MKFSYKGYYEKNLINLTTDLVKTIHHQGGCFLGVSKTEFFVDKIISSLLERGVNQVYLIGGNDTLVSAFEIYKEIKRRMLNIAICVNLKAINKDIAFFDTCFGFESAVEETQKFIEDGHSLAKSNYNSAGILAII